MWEKNLHKWVKMVWRQLIVWYDRRVISNSNILWFCKLFCRKKWKFYESMNTSLILNGICKSNEEKYIYQKNVYIYLMSSRIIFNFLKIFYTFKFFSIISPHFFDMCRIHYDQKRLSKKGRNCFSEFSKQLWL